MLNLAAPRGLDLSLDPDIVAALDDDFDFENPDLELEDDFIGMVSSSARVRLLTLLYAGLHLRYY